MFKPKKGFTLIELLVVIAIIGILATISVLALSNARAKSRDAKRAGDVKQIQTALELFFNDNNRYPTVEEWNTGKIYSTSTGVTSTYMQIIPNAPTPADGLCTDNKNTIGYTPSSDGTSYSISFCLGNTTGTLTPGPKCLTPGGIIDADCFSSEITVCSASTVGGTTCSYGGEDYPTVDINGQVWMAKNLNIGARINSCLSGVNCQNEDPQDQTDNGQIEKYCYADSPGNCQSQGGLYQWDEAMQYSVIEGAQGICPTGWHIPTDLEQDALDQYLNNTTCDANRTGVYDCADAGTKLKSGGTSGFEGLLAGHRNTDGSFNFQGAYTYFLSSSIIGLDAWDRGLDSSSATIYRGHNYHTSGFSVRCLQN